MTTTAAPGLHVNDRYGDSELPPLPLSNETLAVQLAHRSVRSFLPDPVGDEHLEAVVAAAQSAPTSSNLQAWSVVAVRDPARKSRLAALAAEQRFVEEARCSSCGSPTSVAPAGSLRATSDRSPAPTISSPPSWRSSTPRSPPRTPSSPRSRSGSGLSAWARSATGRRTWPASSTSHPTSSRSSVSRWAGPTPTSGPGSSLVSRSPRSCIASGTTQPRADAGIDGYDARLRAYNRRVGLAGGWTERVLRRLAGPGSLAGRDRIRDALVGLGLPSR